MNAETLLHATIGVLSQRGRCYGQWEENGRVCLLGAMGIAAGRTADYWDELRDATNDLEEVDHHLLEAARALASTIDNPVRAPEELSNELLVQVLSAWHDGPATAQDKGFVYLFPPRTSRVFEAIREAAFRLAEKAEASHV